LSTLFSCVRAVLPPLLVVGLIALFCIPVAAGTITVGPSECNYTSIQEAINHAASGDTILVAAGTYPEAIDVNKTLTIRGISGTPTVGNEAENASVMISADGVNLENFRITTGQRWDVFIEGGNFTMRSLNMTGHDPISSADPVVSAENVSGVVIEGCTLETSGLVGISMTNVGGIAVRDSYVETRTEQEGAPHFGFLACYNHTSSSGPEVTNTTFVGGSIRISCSASEVDTITILQNTVTDPDNYGINLYGTPMVGPYQTTNVTVAENRVSGSSSPLENILVKYCADGRIEDNLVEDSYEGADGIDLQYLDNFLIRGNTVRDGSVDAEKGMVAMNLEVIKNSVVSGNTVTDVDPYAYRYSPGPDLLPNLTIDTTNTADGRPVLYYEGADGVSIEGEDLAMLVMLSSSNMQVTGCTFENTGLGVGVYNCSGVTLSGSTFTQANNGMMLIRSCDSVLRGNTFNESFFGLGVGDNSNTIISENTFYNYIDSGIVLHTGDSVNVTISDNLFHGLLTHRDQGIAAVDASADGVEIVNNTFEHNSRGILMSLVEHLTLRENRLTDNGVGVNMLGASNNTFRNNTIVNCDDDFMGLFIVSNITAGSGVCKDNIFANNYIESDVPLLMIPDTGSDPGAAFEFGPIWGPEVAVQPSATGSGQNPWNLWNTTRTNGTNIVGGPYLGGNYWAKPDGTGWSQVTPDRGDGFCTAPFVYDGNNTDYLPLHVHIDPSAGFTAAPCTGYAPLTVGFQDASTGNVTSWNWLFGDGETSDLQNPSHVYRAAGVYSVTLNVTGPEGQSELRRTGYIAVSNPNGGGGGGAPPKEATGTGSLITNAQGLVLRDVLVAAGDNVGELVVPIGSVALDGDGEPLAEVMIEPSDLPSSAGGGTYVFAGYAYACGPDGATFSPAADLVFTFTAEEWAALTADGRPLVVMYYNETAGSYEEVLTSVNAATRTVTASVTHFSSFVLMQAAAAEEETPAPASAASTPAVPAPTVSVPAEAASAPEPGLPLTVIGGVIAVLAVIAGAYFFMRR